MLRLSPLAVSKRDVSKVAEDEDPGLIQNLRLTLITRMINTIIAVRRDTGNQNTL